MVFTGAIDSGKNAHKRFQTTTATGLEAIVARRGELGEYYWDRLLKVLDGWSGGGKWVLCNSQHASVIREGCLPCDVWCVVAD